MQLRDYQQNLDFQINKSWQSVRNVLAVAPTGSGKTVVMAKKINDHVGASVAIAHRSELVSQISIALARFGVYHKIIAPDAMIREIVAYHVGELGRSYYNASATCAVASINTLLARKDKLKNWCDSVTLWVTDEAHHLLESNQWGKGCALFPNAKGLGFTATPLRADGAGLGSHADGVFGDLIETVTMRELIDQGFLTEYRIFAPPSTLDMDGVNTTATGDYSKTQTKKRIERSSILGDVVDHYLKIAPFKLGITFAIDVEEAEKIALRFNNCGVPAKVVNAKTPLAERNKILKQFKRREILQLVNVDLFGEGFDLPALEVVSFARPTMSYSLYVQQFGRVLRLLEGKLYGIIIDHVGNVDRHGLPDKKQFWTLDRREKARRNKHDPDLIPLKTCSKCSGKFEAYYLTCPYCGAENKPTERSTVKQVDGDLKELDPSVLAIMRGEIAKIDEDVKLPWGASGNIQVGIINKHNAKREVINKLRETIRYYGGSHLAKGLTMSQSQKLFYYRFNIDVMTAQTLPPKAAKKLTEEIEHFLNSEVTA